MVEDVRVSRRRPPSAFSAWTLDFSALKERLAVAPRETCGPISSQTLISLPLPDEGFVEVAAAQSRLMEPASRRTHETRCCRRAQATASPIRGMRNFPERVERQ
jgi:hypothetical protein